MCTDDEFGHKDWSPGVGIDVAGHNPSLVAGTTTTTPVLVATVGTTTTWTVGNGDDNSPVLTKQ